MENAESYDLGAQSALITNAARGLGLCVAEDLVSEDARIQLAPKPLEANMSLAQVFTRARVGVAAPK